MNSTQGPTEQRQREATALSVALPTAAIVFSYFFTPLMPFLNPGLLAGLGLFAAIGIILIRYVLDPTAGWIRKVLCVLPLAIAVAIASYALPDGAKAYRIHHDQCAIVQRDMLANRTSSQFARESFIALACKPSWG